MDSHKVVPCGAPTEGSAAEAEAAKDVDGMPEKSGVSSRSSTEGIGLRRVPRATEKGDNSHGERSGHP